MHGKVNVPNTKKKSKFKQLLEKAQEKAGAGQVK
jgi:hypothetical protein